jgi:prepilin-type N-terminal cleavage/methylation domain-containing protein
MRCAKPLESNMGFTLIEIITVIVVLGILSGFTFSFIDNAVKTYSIGSKQRMLYQEAAVAMEKITRELRSAQWFTMNWNYLNRSVYFSKSIPSTSVIDQNRYILYLKPPGENKLYRFSRTTSSGFSDWTWNPTLSPGNIVANNVNTFTIEANSGISPYLNGTVRVILEMEDTNLTALMNTTGNPSYHYLVRMESTVSPKNLQSTPACWYPLSMCSFSSDYSKRNYNGDYEDVVQ